MVGVEAAVVLPVMLLFVGLVIVLANLAIADQMVTNAASQAARAASIERNTSTAVSAARSAATEALREAGVECARTSIDVNAAGLHAPVGTPATVSVTVTCQATFGVSLPGFPKSRETRATATSPVDVYRTR